MTLGNETILFGGSFNPPHIGHLFSCVWLTEALGFSEVILTPTYKHAFNKELADFDHRYYMCRDMAKSNLKIRVSDIEKHLPLPNLTINTLNHFKSKGYDISLAVGSDILKDTDKWQGWDEITKNYKVIVIGRSGYDKVEQLPYYHYPIALSAISSTDIRDRIKSKQSITGLLSADVEQYIEKNKLYL